jgi:2,4-dienoyl-CoA reductase (NADPH2)
MTSSLFSPCRLPNGQVLPNRLAKAAMEENLADANHAPGPALWRLYAQWSQGGAGLILTGNVMVDGRALTGPGGVVLQDAAQLTSFQRWAEASQAGGSRVWMQINHPGRQVYKRMGQEAWAPSAVPLDLGAYSGLFPLPKAMSEADIAEVTARFVRTATLAEQAGFDGVEIHAAHGYLLSQFLSPLSNRRQDAWGGSLENRARLLLDIVRGVRAAVSPAFGVGVKLNSADFQRGGFDVDDARQVVSWLNALRVDLVELSGGSYEAPAMQGVSRDQRTLAREAYFLDFARDIAQVARMPVMVTGGVRRKAVADQVIQSGVQLVGMATALAIRPDLPKLWLADQDPAPAMPAITWNNKSAAAMALQAKVKYQLHRLAKGRPTDTTVSPLRALICDQVKTQVRTVRYRRWIRQQT